MICMALALIPADCIKQDLGVLLASRSSTLTADFDGSFLVSKRHHAGLEIRGN